MAEELTITVGGVTLSGWEDVRVTRGIERFPSDFQITATEKYPGSKAQTTITPGSPCEVRLGGDLVLTGYVDQAVPALTAGEHTIAISGRSKCQDMVDCSAEIEGFRGQMNLTSIVAIAERLAAPYGITVSAPDGSGPSIPLFNVALGETPYEIIERVARYASFLVYDDTAGNLVIARVASSSMASGFTQGVNVQTAMPNFSQHQRFSEYHVFAQPVDGLADGAASLGVASNNDRAQTYDRGVLRNRKLYIIGEQYESGTSNAASRAAWEMSRRWGRSQQLKVTVDSWRDTAGRLWQPNALAPINIPAVHLSNNDWVISEVTYSRSPKTGTTASLVLMPPAAFSINHQILVPYDNDIQQALATAGLQGTQQ